MSTTEKDHSTYPDGGKGIQLPAAVDVHPEMEMIPFSKKKLEFSSLSLSEAKEILQSFFDTYSTNKDFDQDLVDRAGQALDNPDLSEEMARQLVHEIRTEQALFEDSPYAEVRAVVDNFDDVDMPVNTFRSWFIGMLFVTIGTGVNIFFTARNPPIFLNVFCTQVAAYPLAKLMEKVLPERQFTTFGNTWSLNPGKFNQKEHMLITMMSNVTYSGLVSVYTTDIIFVQRLPMYFGEAVATSAGYQLLLTLSSQMIGYSIAGLSRRFLIYPPAMIWPVDLATIALNRSFHDERNVPANGWTISRLRWFTYLFFAYGLYFVVPYAVFTAIEYFNWMTWIAPNNVKLALVTGSLTGLGLNPIPTLDWNWANAINMPLITPLFATLNAFFGSLLIAIPLTAGIYFTNTWETAYLPIMTTSLFDNTAAPYDIQSVVNPDYTLNETAYAAYGPPYQTAGFAVTFFCFFALYTSTLVHCGLYYRRELLAGIKSIFGKNRARNEYNDVHNRIMRNYKEVPEWWFFAVLVISLIFGIVAIEKYDTQMPVWALFFSVALGLIFLIPVDIIGAVTNVAVTLNVLIEIVAGYALPGRPVGFMIFKMYGYVMSAQALQYAQDMKLGHYMHIPPRSTFVAQLIPSIWATFVGLGVADWQIKNIASICDPAQLDGFTCPTYGAFYNSAIQWGTIGPARLYSEGRIYYPLVFGFLLGAVAPIPFYFLTQRYPQRWYKYINVPVLFFGGVSGGTPYNISYLWSGVPLAVYFMYYLRRTKPAWWTKYNYITSTSLTAAMSLFGVLWFFAIIYKNYEPEWWGNTVSFVGCDAMGCPLKEVDPTIGFFGPALGGL